jgi:hypothetical protein
MLGHPSGGDFFDQYAALMAEIFIAAIAIAILVLGHRVSSVLSGVLMLAAAALFSEYTATYYLVFGLPVAAIMLRDPADERVHRLIWRGTFDPSPGQLVVRGRAVVGTAVALATAVTLTRLLIPIQFAETTVGDPVKVRQLDVTTGWLAPVAWMATSVIAVTYGFVNFGDRVRHDPPSSSACVATRSRMGAPPSA